MSFTNPEDVEMDLDGVKRIIYHEIDSFFITKRYIQKGAYEAWNKFYILMKKKIRIKKQNQRYRERKILILYLE